MVGANDVTHSIKPADAVPALAETVRRLRDRGAEVVVGTCPDLGTVKPLQQPLRLLARHLSRRMAAAQTVAVVEAGGRTVSLGDLRDVAPVALRHRTGRPSADPVEIRARIARAMDEALAP